MVGIQNAQAGHRVLLVATLVRRPGQNQSKARDLAESALIKHSLAAGFFLLNKQGVKLNVHKIYSSGSKLARLLAPRALPVQK
jgi:hypothetical protein